MFESALSRANSDLPSVGSSPVARTKLTTSKATRIILADDQTLFRDGLRFFLHKHVGFKVVGEAGPGDDLVKMTSQLRPDVLLLDICSQAMNGMKALGDIQSAGLDVRVIVLTGVVPQSEMLRAMRCGAKGFVLKTSPSTVLLNAIRKVSEGQYWIEQENLAALIQAATDDSQKQGASHNQYGVTPREEDIILAVLDGYSNPDIADKLGLSEQTIKHHLSHIFDKLGVYSRLELALFAVGHQLLDKPGAGRDAFRPHNGKSR